METEPRVMDTYALVYAFTLVPLLPGLFWLQDLTFRVYTFAYVSLVAIPFLLGIAATFFTDSTDGLKREALRTVVLTPLIVITAVALMTGMMLVVFIPLNPLFSQEHFLALSIFAALALVAVAGPLVPALWRRLTGGWSWRSAVQAASLALAIGLVGYTLVLTFDQTGAMTSIVRKDSLIYYVGAVTWYLPSFGLAAGLWRRSGLV